MRQKNTNSTINYSRILMITAAATIVSGLVFVTQYPRRVTQYELDSQRLLHAQDLEQALEWYLIRQAGDLKKEEEAQNQ